LVVALIGFLATVSLSAQAPSPRGGFADLPGVRLWFTDTGGNGQPIVLLHAATGTTESWAPQIEAFAKAGYRVIAFDPRGWGRTIPQPGSGPQPGTAAEDLDALVSFLKLGRFHAVGVAAGAQMALDYAAWRSDRLASLVLAATIGPGAEPEVAAFQKRITVPGLDKLSEEYREVGPSYRGANPDGLKRWIEIAHGARPPAAGDRQPFRLPNDYAKLPLVRVPTLLIAADADLLSPPGMMRLWAGRIAGARWAQVEDAGHSVAWEKPAVFNDLVLRFIKGDRTFPLAADRVNP
jgi:pimeloyl-ACP methyl ester carboxylesterase